MDPETRALIHHLFAEITARLEIAAALAAEGQGARRHAGQDLRLVADLEAALAEVEALVGATNVLLTGHVMPRSEKARGRRRKRPEQ